MTKFQKMIAIGSVLVTAGASNVFAAAGSNADSIAQYDTNHDHKISVQEAMVRGMPIKAFEAADVNHDAYLSASELRGALAAQHKMQFAINDDAVTLKVKSALLQNALVRDLNVQVMTENGVVKLTGFVTHHDEFATAQIMTAGQIAANVVGVERVINNLEITG
ncbi:BON domain-containing protein [Sulfuriferula nivalis]|uniref:BON domain-containing protein n=1 Tax=Sulfuriferula nivalis TaxID=2675298 RepID=A0A809S201_9PROT|nr:BON domain-containing protein [Sulfuriferula nivalis]BBP00648.1 hypothetical protein SFSGTM_13560 [Sulfuriferula nivalis]